MDGAKVNRLKKIINKRTVGIIAQGKSINELETRMHEFKDYDVCWMGTGQFDTVEKFIMEPVGKSLDIVFDSSSIPESRVPIYERTMRIPRLEYYLSKDPSKLWITSHGIYRDAIQQLKLYDFWEKYKEQALIVDSIFPRDEIPFYMDVPNTLSMAAGVALAGGAKNIILFGCDGYTGPVNTGEGILTYYRPEEVKKERMAALGSIEDPGINRDTGAFQKRFKEVYMRYANLFNNCPDVYNCSPITLYTHIRKINYDQALELFKGNKLDIERGEGWHLI